MAVKLVIDSASDISLSEASENGWHLIPMTIEFGEVEYKDKMELSSERFFDMLTGTGVFPHTSQLSPADYDGVFRGIIAQGDTPLAITLSSRLSGTYQSACIAAEATDGKAFVVESLNASLGEAVFVRYAGSLVDEGLEVHEIVRILNEAARKLTLLAIADTLEYLKKGGRISATVEMVGSLLRIKPVIGIVGGEVSLVGKARGMKKALEMMNEMVEESGGADFSKPYTLAYSGNDTVRLDEYIEDSGDMWRQPDCGLPILQIGATIGTHFGPGGVGVAFFKR